MHAFSSASPVANPHEQLHAEEIRAQAAARFIPMQRPIQPPQATPLPASLEGLQGSVTSLGEMMAVLEKKLEFFLAPQPPQDGNKLNAAPCQPTAGAVRTIDNIRSQVDAIQGQLDSILRRLCV